MTARLTLLLVTGCLWLASTTLHAEETKTDEPPDPAELYQKFETTMSGAVLDGQFTVLGKPGPPRSEKYTIDSAEKIADRGDYWMITARIKYGDKNVAVPMPLEVKWAGDTPVITLTNFTIPGLGTFSSRVVIYNDKYAGTWTHGEVGGHLFGTITRPESDEANDGKDKPAAPGAPEDKDKPESKGKSDARQ